MNRQHLRIAAAMIIVIAASIAAGTAAGGNSKSEKAAAAAQEKIARGRYLVGIGGCNDCHTPLQMGPNGPQPDMTRALSGHPEAMKLGAPPKLEGGWVWAGAGSNTAFVGPWGVSYAANLTPERLTGIGIWDEAMFVKTIRTGRHWGVGRPILPPMPVQAVASLTDDDLKAVYAYLRTLKPVRNQVPDAVLAPPPAKQLAAKR